MSGGTLNRLAEAIARQEGFGVSGARPTRNHNPGDLRGWPGYEADEEGFTIFPNDLTGWLKLQQDLEHHAARYPEQSLMEFIAGDGNGWPGYAPASDHNDSAAYAHALAQALGCEVWAKFEDLA